MPYLKVGSLPNRAIKVNAEIPRITRPTVLRAPIAIVLRFKSLVHSLAISPRFLCDALDAWSVSAESFLCTPRDRRFHLKANFQRATISVNLPGHSGLVSGILSKADVLCSIFAREL
jgi:hypothetical protein